VFFRRAIGVFNEETKKHSEDTMKTKATKTATRTKKPQPVILTNLRDRIYIHLRGCERGDIGLLENVPNATISELAKAFDKSEAVIRREVNTLVAMNGAGLLGDRVYPLPGYRMQPVPANPPRETYAKHSTPKTRKIAGHEITLAAGVRYGATRPMAPAANKPVTVSIHELPNRIGDLAAMMITLPNRKQADKFLRGFNGRSSLDGRVW
jgi:hypothetical protein